MHAGAAEFAEVDAVAAVGWRAGVGEAVGAVLGAAGAAASRVFRHILTVTHLTVTLNERYSFHFPKIRGVHHAPMSHPQPFRISVTP